RPSVVDKNAGWPALRRAGLACSERARRRLRADRGGRRPFLQQAAPPRATTSIRDNVAAPDVDAARLERAVRLLGGGVDRDAGAGPEFALVADEVSVDPGLGPDGDLLLAVLVLYRHHL